MRIPFPSLPSQKGTPTAARTPAAMTPAKPATTTIINVHEQPNNNNLPPPPPTIPQSFTTKLTITEHTTTTKTSNIVGNGQQQPNKQYLNGGTHGLLHSSAAGGSSSTSRLLSGYEISQELTSKLHQHLERKYGGRDRAHSAATIIQRRYREYRLKQHFEKKVTAGTGGNRLEQNSKKHQVAKGSPEKRNASTAINNAMTTSGATPILNRRNPYQNNQQQQYNPTMTRYQPLTSLTSQLRVQEQKQLPQNGRYINLNPTDDGNNIGNGNSVNSSMQSGNYNNVGNGQMRQQPQLKHPQPIMQQRNPFMDTPATPRLCQRRVQQIPSVSTVFSAYHQPVTHFHPELSSANGLPHSQLAAFNQGQNGKNSPQFAPTELHSTTVMVDDGDGNDRKQQQTNKGRGAVENGQYSEMAAEQNGLLMVKKTVQNGEEQDEGTTNKQESGYHRSQSPAMHSTNLQVVQLQSSPGRSNNIHGHMNGIIAASRPSAIGSRSQGQSPSSSPMRHPQPPPLAALMMPVDNSKPSPIQSPSPSRSVWMTHQRQFVTGTTATMHQQQIQQRQLAALQQQQQHNYANSSTSASVTSVASQASLPNGKNPNSNGAAIIYAMPSQQQPFHPPQQQPPYYQHQQLQPQNRAAQMVVRSHSSAAAYAHQTNSLPRMGALNLQQQLLQGSPMTQLAKAVANGDITQNSVALQSTTAGVPSGVMQLRPEWSEQQRRRLYRIALNFFNKKPDRGVQLLIRWGFVEDSPRALALLFKERKGLSKQMIGEYLGTLKCPFHSAVLDHFIAEIPMYDMEIDKALRQLLMHFRLPGEAQKIDHIIQAFARRYVAFNTHRLSPSDTPDTVYILAFAVIMLNTDLHTPSLKDSRRMKLDEFIKNLARVEEGRNLDKQMLTGIYERVKEFEFRAGTDHVTQVMKVDQSIISKDKPKLVEPHRRLICYCRLHQVIDPNKRQSSNAHQREIFLFNDMMLVCKMIGGRRRSSTTTSIGQYQQRYWSLLIGLRVEEFQNSLYAHGMMLSFPDGQVLFFNAKNGEDRYRFIADINESVAESTEMEQWRIQLEMERQQQQNQPSTNHPRHLAGIGARLAEHNFQMGPQEAQQHGQEHQQQRHNHQLLKENGANGGGMLSGGSGSSAGSLCLYQHQHNKAKQHNTSIASSAVTTTDNSIQRDSGLPDMDCCQNSVGHSHSTVSSPPSSASPSPADFT